MSKGLKIMSLLRDQSRYVPFCTVSHEACENKEQGKFQSRWASLYTWLTYDKDKNKMYCSKCISIGAKLQGLLPLELLRIA